MNNSWEKLFGTINLILLLFIHCLNAFAQEIKPEFYVQTGGGGSVVFSSDGSLIALGVSFGDKSVTKLMDYNMGIELRSFTGKSLGFSPDGRMFATLDENNIKIWNVTSGAVIKTFAGYDKYFYKKAAFSQDWKLIAFLDSFGIIKIIDVGLEKEIQSLVILTESEFRLNIDSFAFSPDGKTLAVAKSYDSVKLWDIKSGKVLKPFEENKDPGLIALPPDGTKMFVRVGNSFTIWDSATGKKIRTFRKTEEFNSFTISPDGKKIATTSRYGGYLKLWDVNSGELLWEVRSAVDSEFYDRASFSPDGKTIVASGNMGISLRDASSGRELKKLTGEASNIYSIALTNDTKMLAIGYFGKIKLWDLSGTNGIKTIKDAVNMDLNLSMVFSIDGKTITSVPKPTLWDVVTGKKLHNFSNNTFVLDVAVSPDGQTIAASEIGSASYNKTIKIWDINTGKELKSFKTEILNIGSIDFSPDGQKIAIREVAIGSFRYEVFDIASGKSLLSLTVPSEDSKLPGDILTIFPQGKKKKQKFTSDGRLTLVLEENLIKLLDAKSGEQKASLTVFGENNWLVSTPQGFFDGTPNAWKQIIWRFDNNTFSYAPVEVFFKEFYRPGLLQDILNGNEIEPPSQDLSKIDIRQPSVKISEINGKAVDSSALLPDEVSADKKSVRVKVEITDNASDPRPGIDKVENPSSDANDIRLFRNGSMVRLWGKIAKQTNKSVSVFALTEKDGCKQIPATKDSPRKAVCETDVAITAGKNELTAYGFNRQDVKSADNSAVVNGAESLKRDGTLYVLAVGVNDYTPVGKSDWDLSYAVKDVQEIGKTLQDSQTKLGNLKQYARTEIVTLTDEAATKDNILNALRRFAEGGDKTALPANVSEKVKAELSKIKPTQPEDGLIIYFAGHGVSQKERFYLLPHNFTGDAARIVEQSVSDLELNDYLEKVDAGRLLMVIDACQSGAALGGKNDGRAPMNSKGFAQLAYDKGMLILTAAQSQQAALEAVRIGDKTIENGLLTYALLQAFTTKESDKDANNQIWEREWFDFAVNQVPQFQREAMRQREVDLKTGSTQTKGRSGIFYVNGDEKKKVEERSVQTPRVFYRRETSANPFVISAF